MYSASAADNATVACFWLSQLIAPPDIVNTITVVECLLSESFAQSASEYPNIFSLVDLYCNFKSIVPFRY